MPKIDERVFKALLNIETHLNELSASIKISGLNARREKLTRLQASTELEALADRVAQLSEILEKMYGREGK